MNKKKDKQSIKVKKEYELKLRTEGRDFFKHELLLDIEKQQKKGWEASNILENVKNLLRF